MKHIIKDVLKSEYTPLVYCPFIKERQLRPIVRREFESKAVHCPDLLAVIDKEWDFAIEHRPYLFNQSKFRYHDSDFDGICHMRLGLTDYKSYVGSNLGREWKRFFDEGVMNGNANDYFANPLGNQCVVVLRDGYHVVVNRSHQVAEGEGKLTCLGGHPEPLNLHIRSYEDAEMVDEDTLANELFNSINHEVLEESNIPLDSIVDTRMIGVVASNATHGREIQMFCCFVNLDKTQVEEYYKQGPEDQYESVGINFMTLDRIVDIMNTTPDKFVPEARGLYTLLVNQEEEFERVFQSLFMICGIGTDIIKISRIQKTFSRFGNQFVNRILSARELSEYNVYTRDKAQFLASRWAIKEATYKALQTPGIPFNSIQVLSVKEEIRSPLYLEFTGKAKEAANKLGVSQHHVSVSHEDDYCVAFVILEKQE